MVPACFDTNLSFEIRAKDLVYKMTVEEKVSRIQNDAPAIRPLGIPASDWWNECLHCVARNAIATVFTHAIGKGEHRTYTGLTFWAPNINVERDPRWGRGQETYGEDPFLTSKMATAFIMGLQGRKQKYFKAIGTHKDFGAYSGPELLNHRSNAEVSKRDLFDTYLPAFESAVKEGGA